MKGSIAYLWLDAPHEELVRWLYKRYSFSEESMLADYSKLYIRLRKKRLKRIDFSLAVAIIGERIIGWGIATSNLARIRKREKYYDVFQRKEEKLIMIYVNKKFRGIGAASGILNILAKKCKKFSVIGHDEISHSFFYNFRKKFKNKMKILDWR